MKSKRIAMETGCDIKSGVRSAALISKDHHQSNDSDVPTLSITAPSEEVSEIEDNVGSSSSQTPAQEHAADKARDEAKKVVGDVLSLASEILQSKGPESSSRTETDNIMSDDINDELASIRSLAGSKRWSIEGDERVCPDVRYAANDFVKDVIEKAWHEANRRMETSKDSQDLANHSERFETVETLSAGDPDKRRPWYRRARSSARKLLYRLRICGRDQR